MEKIGKKDDLFVLVKTSNKPGCKSKAKVNSKKKGILHCSVKVGCCIVMSRKTERGDKCSPITSKVLKITKKNEGFEIETENSFYDLKLI